jgi:hypothetical protein
MTLRESLCNDPQKFEEPIIKTQYISVYVDHFKE